MIWAILGGMLAVGLGMIIFLARREGAASAISKGQKGLLQNVGKAKKATEKLRAPANRKRLRDKFTR